MSTETGDLRSCWSIAVTSFCLWESEESSYKEKSKFLAWRVRIKSVLVFGAVIVDIIWVWSVRWSAGSCFDVGWYSLRSFRFLVTCKTTPKESLVQSLSVSGENSFLMRHPDSQQTNHAWFLFYICQDDWCFSGTLIVFQASSVLVVVLMSSGFFLLFVEMTFLFISSYILTRHIDWIEPDEVETSLIRRTRWLTVHDGQLAVGEISVDE